MYNMPCVNTYTHSHCVYSVPTKAKALWEILGGVRHRSSSQGVWEGYDDLKSFTIPEILTFLHDLVVEIG